LAATIARVAGDFALVIDDQGVISSVATGSAPGLPGAGQWIGRRWADTANAQTRRKVELLLAEAQAGGVTARREINHPAPDGADIPVAWSAIRLGAGGPVIAAGRDLRTVAAIQQQFMEAQQEIERGYWQRRQADERYRLLFQAASDAVMVLDAESFEVVDANEAAHKLFAGPGASLVGLPWPGELAPLARAAVHELLAAARSSGRGGEIRVRLGSGIAADVAATPFRAGDRQQLLVRARASDAAAAAVSRMSALVDSTPDAVVICDSGGHVQLVNAAFVGLLGAKAAVALHGRPLTALVGDAQGQWQGLVDRVCALGMVSREVHTLIVAQRVQTVEVTAALMTEGDQISIGLMLRPAAPTVTLALQSGPTEQLLQGLAELSAQLGRIPLDELLAEAAYRAERLWIESALQRVGGDLPMAAEILGLSPDSLFLRLRRLGLAHAAHGGHTGPPTTFN
jgi:transcriptional regulator PpsR